MSAPVVWITGASSGIGEALAYAYASRGYALVLSARNTARLEEVKARCSEAEKIWIRSMDMAEHDQIPEITQEVLSETGRIDILISNAGITQRSLVSETALEVDKQIMDVNFLGVVAHTKAVLPHMLEHNSGKIVTISSIAGRVSTPLRSAYAASKHALHGFFESMRLELKDTDLKVILLCPGFVQTQVSVNALTASGGKQGTMDPRTASGMPVEVFAQKALRAIDRNGKEVYITRWEWILIYLKRFFPGLLDFLLKRMRAT